MVVIKIGIILCYLHISALATTDTMRLLKDCNLSVFDPSCVCDKCGHKISLIYQIPIISFIFIKGKCKYCGAKIEIKNFLFEIFFLLYYIFVSLIFDFSVLSVFVCFISYETFKSLFILIKGRKKHNFFKEYFFSIFSNIFIFSLVSLLALLKDYVEVIK